MLTGLDFPGSRKNFPFPGKKFPDRENFGKLRNPYQACLCNSKPPPPTLTHVTMPWTGGEAYTHGDCLWNDRRLSAVKIRQYWHWNNSALYSRWPDIRPPKSRETRPVCHFTVAVPPPCYDVLMPTKRDLRAVANNTALHSVDQRVTWYPPWTRGGGGGVGHRSNAPTIRTPCPTLAATHTHVLGFVVGKGRGWNDSWVGCQWTNRPCASQSLMMIT